MRTSLCAVYLKGNAKVAAITPAVRSNHVPINALTSLLFNHARTTKYDKLQHHRDYRSYHYIGVKRSNDSIIRCRSSLWRNHICLPLPVNYIWARESKRNNIDFKFDRCLSIHKNSGNVGQGGVHWNWWWQG